MLNKKQIMQVIRSLKVNESDSVSDCGSVTRTSKNTYAVCDNGEQVDGLDLRNAVRVAHENNLADG